VPPRELAGQPGTRAPHVPVTLAGRDISTLDLNGSHLVLITGNAGDGWASAAAKLDVPVDAYRLGAEVCSAYGIEAGGVSLVRPDGFVAWRTNSGVPDPVRTLADAVRSVLFR
jgi:hypothetical protein